MFWWCVGIFGGGMGNVLANLTTWVGELAKSWLCVGGGVCSFALFAVAQDVEPRTCNVTCVVWTLSMSSSMVVGWSSGQCGCARFAWGEHCCREQTLIQHVGVILLGAIVIVCVSNVLICFEVFDILGMSLNDVAVFLSLCQRCVGNVLIMYKYVVDHTFF